MSSANAIPIGPLPIQGPAMPTEDEDISRAIEMSLLESGNSVASYEPLKAEQRLRIDGIPVGLKNIGNTCYFNSLMQSYFMIPTLVEKILNFRPHPSQLQNLQDDSVENTRKKASIELVKQLQRLFAHMIRSNRLYVDPGNVLKALVDDFGNQIAIGDQKDVGEFNMNLVARIEEGLQTAQPYEENKEKRLNESPTLINRKGSMVISGHEISEEGIISELFYGKQHEFLEAAERDGSLVQIKNLAPFGQIIVDVDEGDLYSAWDIAYHSQIEGYLTPQENATTASQEFWLEKLPGIILFQIQRVKYDKVTNSTIKIHKQFKFPKILHPDRFMAKNKEIGSKLRENMLLLKNRIKFLEASLEKLNNYNSTNSGLDTILQQTIEFLSYNENPNQAMEIDEEGLIIFTPEKVIANNPQISRSKTLLQTLTREIVTKIKLMKTQLEQYQFQIEEIFNVPQLKNHEYHLHSILIHDGQAGAGHYYAYVYDAEYEVWRKYSDVMITQVEESEVMTNALGGNGYISAYCLMYIENSLIRREAQGRIKDFRIKQFDDQPFDLYQNLLSAELKREVDEENKKTYEEAMEYKINKTIQHIQDVYSTRFTQTVGMFNNYKNELKNKPEDIKYELINFAVHLKIKGQEFLCKWYLLDSCLREEESVNKGISDFDKADPIYMKLGSQFKNVCKEAPHTLELSATDINTLMKELNEFNANYRSASVSLYLYDFLLNDKIISIYHLVNAFGCLNENNSNEIQRMPSEIYKISLLHMTTIINQTLYIKNVKDAIAWANHLSSFTTATLSQNDPFYTQIYFRLQDSRRWALENLIGIYNDDYDKELREIIMRMEKNVVFLTFDPNFPAELQELKMKIEGFNNYAWAEGWQKDSIAVKYAEMKNSFFNSRFAGWIRVAERITITRNIVPEIELREMEMRTGFFPQ
ncbi:USP28_3 [Blepharisma stoltei]|uniref:Ubiquitin carboxyl-terminal hydrolase n=1 Tax=Blepharisma stoltei TaxID=1481888 RepID=A0AAU9J3Y8_9CILI|nr:unnamed protein product [Blepharisma stoltei]